MQQHRHHTVLGIYHSNVLRMTLQFLVEYTKLNLHRRERTNLICQVWELTEYSAISVMSVKCNNIIINTIFAPVTNEAQLYMKACITSADSTMEILGSGSY